MKKKHFFAISAVLIIAVVSLVYFMSDDDVNAKAYTSLQKKAVEMAKAVSVQEDTDFLDTDDEIYEPDHARHHPFCKTKKFFEIIQQEMRRDELKEAMLGREVSKFVSAEYICLHNSSETPCVLRAKRIACQQDAACEYFEDEHITDEEVESCFVRQNNESYANYHWLPPYCNPFEFMPPSLLHQTGSPLPLSKVSGLPPQVQQWADKVQPGHVAGIARGISFILKSNEELREATKDSFPTLEIVAASGGDDPSVDQAAGIVIGLFNAGIGMVENHVESHRQKHQELCKKYEGKDIIPLYCIPMTPRDDHWSDEAGDDLDDTELER